ncbi:MAG: hypothetical protein IJN44_11290 [Clostridia bacterium]|nr:hypothetical protein [Clostridia bacterium]
MLEIIKTVLPSPEQWEIIIEGMRNPMNSWAMSDSLFRMFISSENELCEPWVDIGPNDHDLMMRLAKGGPVHGKYRRMIPVMFTVTAPTFWWIEFDTYKVGTVRNSCSKMHKIHVEPFSLDNFAHEGCDEVPEAMETLKDTIARLEWLRQKFNETQEKKYWRALLELLPHGYMMKATISLNYEVLHNIYHGRRNHKVVEWHTFCDWIEQLPYSEIITVGG